MNGKLKVLKLVEKQTHKTYGEREGRKFCFNLPLEFPNTAICLACGKERHVNTCGFCEECWVTL